MLAESSAAATAETAREGLLRGGIADFLGSVAFEAAIGFSLIGTGFAALSVRRGVAGDDAEEVDGEVCADEPLLLPLPRRGRTDGTTRGTAACITGVEETGASGAMTG